MCVCVCVWPVGDGESAVAVKSLGRGHCGRTRRRRRCVERNLVDGGYNSGSRGPEAVVREKWKEVNRSDLFRLRLFFSIWAGLGGNGFAVNI